MISGTVACGWLSSFFPGPILDLCYHGVILSQFRECGEACTKAYICPRTFCIDILKNKLFLKRKHFAFFSQKQNRSDFSTKTMCLETPCRTKTCVFKKKILRFLPPRYKNTSSSQMY